MSRGTLLAFLLLLPSAHCWGQVAPTGSTVDGTSNVASGSVLDSITPLADSATPPEEVSPQPWKLFQTQNINIGGWSQTGYHSRSDGMFNNSPDRIRQHQTWFFAEKVADGSCGTGLGFRVDYVYGTDGPDTQAFGNPAGVGMKLGTTETFTATQSHNCMAKLPGVMCPSRLVASLLP